MSTHYGAFTNEPLTLYEKWYYCSYLLLRSVCWFVLGLLFASVFQLLSGCKEVNTITLGAIFSMAGGFFLGIFRILIEE